MQVLRVNTQDELDAALAMPTPHKIWMCGTGNFVVRQSANHYVRASERSHVEAWESSHVVALGSSHVVARGSSHVEALGSSHVVARGSSHVVARGSSHVEAWESSHVEAWGSSHVVAWGSSHVEAWGSSHVVAWGAVLVRARDRASVKCATSLIVVMNHATTTAIDGGTVVQVPPITTVEAWCDYYGVDVKDGIATLYKGVRDDYQSAHSFSYLPGSIPIAPDWDGGTAECGGGLHFSPRPIATKDFDCNASKFLACPIRLEDIRVPREGDSYPAKLKAKGCCAAVTEVDIYGKPVAPKTAAV